MNPSLTRVRRFLNLAKFNPRKSGILGVISDIDNTEFLRYRAIEIIKESSKEDDFILATRVITLLALRTEDGRTKAKVRKTRVKNTKSHQRTSDGQCVVSDGDTREHVPTRVS